MNACRHRLSEVGQVMLGDERVQTADLTTLTDGQQVLEVVIGPDVDTVPPSLLSMAADHDCALAPDLTATRGDPCHVVAVFE